MSRIGILTCSNCTQDTNCASVVCLADMRKRHGHFDRYPAYWIPTKGFKFYYLPPFPGFSWRTPMSSKACRWNEIVEDSQGCAGAGEKKK